MEVVETIIALFILFLGYIIFVFVSERAVIDGYIEYALKTKEEEKLRKNMRLKEWLLFSRFRSILPKSLLYPYYFFLLLYPLGFIACLYISFFSPEYSSELVDRIVVPIFCIHVIYMGAFNVLFWTSDRTTWAYERWYKLPREREEKLKQDQMKKGKQQIAHNKKRIQEQRQKKQTELRRESN